MLTILYAVFTLVIVIQVSFFLLFSRFSFLKSRTISSKQFHLSVIICAKNEAKNLKQNLEKILSQNHPDFEVIVVNDASTDETQIVLENFQKKYQQLKVIIIKNTPTYNGNKKNAITKGVIAAKNEYLIFTDADCKPISENWLDEVSSNFSNHKTIVLGYGAYQKIKNSLLNKLIRFETLLTATQYFSYTTIGFPYMGVGRNLAYKKELFIKANGLENHKHIQSGDDDLFINQMATKENTSICFSKNSFTVSKPNTDFKSWYKQKRRHVTTATHYKPFHKLLLGLYYLSQFLFWVVAIILLAFAFKWQLIIILIILRLLFQYVILGSIANKLNEKELFLWLPLLDIMLVFIQFTLYINNLIVKPKSW